jgi:hypothetical protein
MCTLGGPIILNLVFPFRWLENEVKGMLKELLAPLNDVMFLLIALMASFSCSIVHFSSSCLIRSPCNCFVGLAFLAYLVGMFSLS